MKMEAPKQEYFSLKLPAPLGIIIPHRAVAQLDSLRLMKCF